MSEQYRLAFSGEVHSGQHPAVVKKRLAAILKLDAQRMDILFSGKQVTVRRQADGKTAVRFRELFNRAGAVLQVLLVNPDAGEGEQGDSQSEQPQADPEPEPEPETQSEAESARSSTPTADTAQHYPEVPMAVLPVGSGVLADNERREIEEADIDTSHLKFEHSTFTVSEPPSVVQGPNVDHITLAEPGVELGVAVEEEIVIEIDADFDLAEVGAILKELGEEPVPVIDVEAIDFPIAEAGAILDTSPKSPPPEAPYTGHLSLEGDDPGQNK